MNASGCGVTVKEYGHILQDDPAYAAKAARISALTQDLSELLPALVPAAARPSCQAQAGQTLVASTRPAPCSTASSSGGVEKHLGALGFKVRCRQRSAPVLRLGRHLLGAQPQLSYQLRDRKLGHLADRCRPEVDRRRPTSAASPTCKAAPPRRCGTGWRCWTKPCSKHYKIDSC